MKYLGYRQARSYGVKCSKCTTMIYDESPVHTVSMEDGTHEAKVLCTKCLSNLNEKYKEGK